jgi:transcriptional regulator with XRE-family HTH domain
MFRNTSKGNVARRIRRYRLDRGLTQETAAEHYGCTLRHWQRLEDGTQNPSLTVLVRISRVLAIKPFKLLV